MQIESVLVKHFGLLHHFELKLGDKLNVIEGSNESGKSTLSAFVRFMLYGFPSDEEGVLERRHRTSWDTGTAEGEMTVRVGNRRYRIERYSAIVRNAAGGEEFRDRTRTIDAVAGSLVTETSAGEYFLGVPNEVYVSSAFISQLDDTHVGEDRMLDQISNLLFTGDKRVSAERAAEMLRERRDALLAAAGEHGDLSVLRRRAEELVEERSRAVEINRTLLAREAETVKNRRRRAELDAEISKLEKLRSSFKTVAVINNFDKLHNLEREKYLLEGEEAEFRLKYMKNGFLPDASYRTELTINLRVAGDAYGTYRAAQEELVTQREESERGRETERVLFRIDRHGGEGKVRAGLRALRRNTAIFFGLAGAFFALAVLSAVLGIADVIPSGAVAATLMGVTAFFGAAGLLLGCGRYRRVREFAADYGFATVSEFSRFLFSAEAHRSATDERARSLRRAEETLERAKRTYLASYTSLSETVGRWGRTLPEVGVGAVIEGMVKEIDEILKIGDGYDARKREMEAELNTLRGRLSGENEGQLRDSLSPELRDTLCDMSYEEILQGIKQRGDEIERLDREKLYLSDEIDGLREAATNPIELDEKIQILKEKITSIRELQGALSLAYEAVSGADENLRSEIRPRLSDYSRRLMSAMTDGKYDDVGVSDDLILEFRREETSRSVDYLSGGTRDLAYIALRLAYIDLLYKEAPPLVFDESFAHQDNFRATCTMKALRALAEEGVQSLIFTCRSRESTIAREVDRKYKHIKMEKLRAEAEALAAKGELDASPETAAAQPIKTALPEREGIPLTGDPELDALLLGQAKADPQAALESAFDALLAGDAAAVAAGEIASFAVPEELINEAAQPEPENMLTFEVSPELLREEPAVVEESVVAETPFVEEIAGSADAPEEIEAPDEEDAPEEIEALDEEDAPEEIEEPDEEDAPEELEASDEEDAPEEIEALDEEDAPEEIEALDEEDAPEELEALDEEDAPEELEVPDEEDAPEETEASDEEDDEDDDIDDGVTLWSRSANGDDDDIDEEELFGGRL